MNNMERGVLIMYNIVCKNIFLSDSEEAKSRQFNKLWQNIVNLIINR